MDLVAKRYRYVSVQINNFWAYYLSLERRGIGKQIKSTFPLVWWPRWVLLDLWSAWDWKRKWFRCLALCTSSFSVGIADRAQYSFLPTCELWNPVSGPISLLSSMRVAHNCWAGEPLVLIRDLVFLLVPRMEDLFRKSGIQAFLCIYYLNELLVHNCLTAQTGKQTYVSQFTWSAVQRKFRDLMGRKRQEASQRQQRMLDILTLPRHSDSWSCDPLSVLQQMVIRNWCTEVLLLLYMERGN